MKIIRNKNILIIILVLTIICLSISLCLITAKLKNYEKNNKIYDVSIVKIKQGTAIKGGETLPTAKTSIINNNKTANFLFSLNNPKDILTYIITIKNNGNLKAKIDGLVENPDYLNNTTEKQLIFPVVITHNNVNNQQLNPGEELNITITVEFTNNQQPIHKTIPYQVSILTSCID